MGSTFRQELSVFRTCMFMEMRAVPLLLYWGYDDLACTIQTTDERPK